MAKAQKLAILFVAITIASVMFIPINATINDHTGETTVENESVTASVGEYVELEGYDIVTDSETVERYNNTSDSWDVMTEGTDYEMDYGPGEVQALSGGEISDGDKLRVTYDYEATSGTTTTILTLVPLFVGLLIIGVMASRVTEMM